ncbi:MAG: hypothetical protein GWO24_04550 [Akkermansiaceae bacterium]|nr:hypothetical protein [Akkermansiaceae bacterium]
MPFPEALALAAGVIEEAGEREVAADGWEAAALDRTRPRRKFRRLSIEEIESARSGDAPT